ncbi:MAG TPA: discoidin domain-containing protein [Bacillota bacterium]|nr:discoidin domain-containing protein [Bacillota bacterium]
MKKIAILMTALLVLIACTAFYGCDPADTSSTAAESKPVSEAVSEAVSEPDDVSAEESDPAPVIAEPTETVDKSLTRTNIALNCSYTAPENNRADGWDDDGIKLTDGVINETDGGQTTWFGFTGSGINSIVLDLGEEVSGICEFELYIAYGTWGISAPVSVCYYISDDGETWTAITEEILSSDVEPIYSVTDSWSINNYLLSFDSGFTARYIKYDITSDGHVWVDAPSAYIYE